MNDLHKQANISTRYTEMYTCAVTICIKNTFLWNHFVCWFVAFCQDHHVDCACTDCLCFFFVSRSSFLIFIHVFSRNYTKISQLFVELNHLVVGCLFARDYDYISNEIIPWRVYSPSFFHVYDKNKSRQQRSQLVPSFYISDRCDCNDKISKWN